MLGLFALKHALVGKSFLARSESLFNLAAATAMISGYPIFKSGFKSLAARGRINHDLVMSALSLGTLLARESIPGLLVVWLVNLSSLLQSLVLAHSRKSVEDLLAVSVPTIIRDWTKEKGSEELTPKRTLLPQRLQRFTLRRSFPFPSAWRP